MKINWSVFSAFFVVFSGAIAGTVYILEQIQTIQRQQIEIQPVVQRNTDDIGSLIAVVREHEGGHVDDAQVLSMRLEDIRDLQIKSRQEIMLQLNERDIEVAQQDIYRWERINQSEDSTDTSIKAEAEAKAVLQRLLNERKRLVRNLTSESTIPN